MADWLDNTYNFNEPLPRQEMGYADHVIGDLIETKTFKRLQDIRFLGGIDYRVVRNPNGSSYHTRYTRYQHSIGVAVLAMFYSNFMGLSDSKRKIVITAALLHDLGHAPLSHSLEPVFKEHFNLEHHKATECLIRGETRFGDEVRRVLQKHDVDVESVIATIAGQDDLTDGFFSGPINFDTVEGIVRASMYARNEINPASPLEIIRAAIGRKTDRDVCIVDEFWFRKNMVYQSIVNSQEGVLADLVCQEAMRSAMDRISSDDYFSTESAIFLKMPELRSILTQSPSLISALPPTLSVVQVRSRRFFIDLSYSFFSREDARRYRQERGLRELRLGEGPARIHTHVERDLFDDDGLRNFATTLKCQAARPSL